MRSYSKQSVFIVGMLFLGSLLIVPALARSSRAEANSNSNSNSKSAERSQAKSTSQSAPSRQSRPAASSSRTSGSSRQANTSRQSAPPSRASASSSRSSRQSASPQRSTSSASRASTSSRPAQSRSSSSTSSRSPRPVNRTVEVASRSTQTRSTSVSVQSRPSVSVASKSNNSRVSRTVVPGNTPSRVTTQISASTSTSRANRDVTPRATASGAADSRGRSARKEVTVSASSRSARNSDETSSVRGRATREKTETTASTIAKTDTGSSRVKVVDINSRTRRTSSREVASNTTTLRETDKVRIDPQTSSASRYVQRKTAPRTESGHTRESRASRTESITTSTVTSDTTRSRRTPTTTTVTNTNTTIVTASDLGRDRTSFRRRREAEPKIVINGDNNVIVQGDVTTTNPRPVITSRHLTHDISHVRHDSHWKSHSGFYFSFTWSNSSCGRVAYLPYRYRHSWCHDPIGYYPYYGLSYYYPRYHRRYIYVSLGGYWPSWYRYRRYYWYGCHPYYWYGADVITEPRQNVTYNTYNYYTTEPSPSGYGFTGSAQPYYDLGNPDPDKVDVPEYETAADLCFANAVDLFEAGNYADAVLQLQEAVSLSPDDIVLPFTYAQALFANGDYAHAASVLREAIAQIPEDELTIYYPRGLYKDDATLTQQIEQLKTATKKELFDSDYQLLLGYQYLGTGELDKAYPSLSEALKNEANAATAGKLLELAAKLEAESSKSK